MTLDEWIKLNQDSPLVALEMPPAIARLIDELVGPYGFTLTPSMTDEREIPRATVLPTNQLAAAIGNAHHQLLEQVPSVRACPECLAGKHDNCPGDAWDDVRDALVDCPCYARGHRPEDVVFRDIHEVLNPDVWVNPEELERLLREPPESGA